MQIIAEHKLTELTERHDPESAAQWLIRLLDLLASIVNRNEDLSHIAITETEYQQLLGVLNDLIHGVGENEDHVLSSAMTLVGSLIKAYEDEHFPKLAEGISVKVTGESDDSKLDETE